MSPDHTSGAKEPTTNDQRTDTAGHAVAYGPGSSPAEKGWRASGGAGYTTGRRPFIRAVGAGALALGIGSGALSTATVAANESFVQTDGTDFVLDGEPIYFNGSNNFWLMDTYYGTPSLHDTILSMYDRLGLNFVRTWGFKDGTSEHGPMLQPEPRTYNEETFQRFDSLVAKAGEYGVKLVLPLVNNWEEYGGKGQYVEWVDSASNPDEFYTNEECKQIYKDYVEYVLTRENTITGVEYRDDPAIAIWELANEPRAPNLSNSVQAMGEWVAEMSAHIKDLAPDQLVSTGMEGFYDGSDHGSGYGYQGGEGIDYVAHHQIDTIDVCTYHIYPDAWGKSPDWAVDWIAQHQSDAEAVIGKPAYCGEFGLDFSNYSMTQRNQHYRNWYDALDQHDADGALIWQIDRGTRADAQSGHGVYEDDTETLQIVRDYGAVARQKSGIELEPDAPHTPTGVALTGRTDTSIDVVWDPTVGWGAGADGYSVTVDGQEATTVSADTTSTTITGLDPSTSYGVTVRAVDVEGETSDPSVTATLSTLPTDVSTVTDPCEDTSMLASGSDTGTLATDTTNATYFVRPDGSTDGSRLNRSAQEDAAMVYAVDGQLLDVAVEFHVNASNGGDVEYYESADGGATWQPVEFVRTVYDPPGDGGWSNQLHSRAGFSSGADRVRIVLTGGDAAWSIQVGNVELTVGDDTSTPSEGPPAVGDNENAPTDPDGDDRYEDVNGNGNADFDDIVTFFEHMNDEVVQNHVAAFDFNGNGQIDFADVVALFEAV